jgi:hypothetical protein
MADLLSDADIGIAPPSKGGAAGNLLSDEDIGLGSGKRVAYTPGQAKYAEDEALLAKNAGMVPDALKAGAWSAGNTALLYAPRAAAATYSSFAEDKPLSQAWEEQRQYEEALSRQHPTASAVGTGIGLVGGLAVPLGPVGTLGKAAEAATAARLGTTAGRIAEGATIGSTLSGISGFAETLDPREALKSAALGAGLGGAATPILGALGNYFTKLPAVVDGAGNLTKDAEAAISTAFQGKMSAEDIASFKDQLVNAFQTKGISPEAAKEALLAKEGVTPTRSLVTGEAAPKSAADIGERAAADAEKAIGQKAEALSGTPVERTAIAESLPEKVLEAERATQKQYDLAKGIKGEFPATVPVGDEGRMVPALLDKVMPSVQKSLQDKGIPTTFDSTTGYTKAEQAMKYLNNGLLQGNYPYAGPLNAYNIEAINQDLNRFWRAARSDPQDQRAVAAIRRGFQNAVNDNIVLPSMFTGDGQKVIDQLAKSRTMWADMQNTFYPKKGAGTAEFRKMMNSLIDTSTGKISASLDQGAYDTAQTAINSSLLSPHVGSVFYERLEKALGAGTPEMNAVQQHIRKLALDTGGDMSKLPKKIDSFLANSPTVADKVFKPEELSSLRRLSETAKIINAKPISQPEKDGLLAKAVGKIVSLGIGAATYPFHGGLGALAGYATGELAGAAKRGVSTALSRRAEAAGAAGPTKASEAMRVFNQPPSAGSVIRNVPAMQGVGVEGYQEPTMLPPLTIHRATGGRVAAKLVSEVERAKKMVNSRTESLLNADDSHVARALEIANQNFEG